MFFWGGYTVFACLDVSVGRTASVFRMNLLVQMFAEVIWKKKCVSYEKGLQQIGQSELRRVSVQVLYSLSSFFSCDWTNSFQTLLQNQHILFHP